MIPLALICRWIARTGQLCKTVPSRARLVFSHVQHRHLDVPKVTVKEQLRVLNMTQRCLPKEELSRRDLAKVLIVVMLSNTSCRHCRI